MSKLLPLLIASALVASCDKDGPETQAPAPEATPAAGNSTGVTWEGGLPVPAILQVAKAGKLLTRPDEFAAGVPAAELVPESVNSLMVHYAPARSMSLSGSASSSIRVKFRASFFGDAGALAASLQGAGYAEQKQGDSGFGIGARWLGLHTSGTTAELSTMRDHTSVTFTVDIAAQPGEWETQSAALLAELPLSPLEPIVELVKPAVDEIEVFRTARGSETGIHLSILELDEATVAKVRESCLALGLKREVFEEDGETDESFKAPPGQRFASVSFMWDIGELIGVDVEVGSPGGGFGGL